MEAQLQSHFDKKNKAIVTRVVLAQLAVSAIASLILLALLDSRAAVSALLGGIISTLASFYTGRRFFTGGAATAQQRLAAMYTAEVLKLVFVAAAFCLSFMLMDVYFPAFIGAYLLTLVVYWLAMVWPVFGVHVKTHH